MRFGRHSRPWQRLAVDADLFLTAGHRAVSYNGYVSILYTVGHWGGVEHT